MGSLGGDWWRLFGVLLPFVTLLGVAEGVDLLAGFGAGGFLTWPLKPALLPGTLLGRALLAAAAGVEVVVVVFFGTAFSFETVLCGRLPLLFLSA